MKFFIIIILFASICFGIRPDYFQQHVAYDIEVTLDDSAHTLQAFEKIVYTNNSPDTLDFIWFHIWPNAYKNTETAFAKQQERFLSTKFILSEEKDRGYIDSLDFKIDGESIITDPHSEWIDVVKLLLPNPLFPGKNITVIGETIALNHLLRLDGYHPAREFNGRLVNIIRRKQKD